MKIEYLKYFVSVAESLSFTKAAKENHIAQSAISRYIANLEHELGIRLLDRNNRHVKLSLEGAQFYLDIAPVLVQFDQAVKNAMSVQKGFLGHIHIGIGAYEDVFVSALLKDFHVRYPSFKVTLVQFSYSQLCEMIQHGELDIAFVNTFFVMIRKLPGSRVLRFMNYSMSK